METNNTVPESEPDRSEVLVSNESDGLRVDRFLSSCYPEVSRSFLQNCIRQRQVLLNNRPCRSADRIRPGDRIAIDWPGPVSTELAPEPIPLDIIFEDDDILVVNKPPALVVHPTDNCRQGTLVNALIYHDEESFSELAGDNNIRPGIVHRLDKDTSGVLVVAKNTFAKQSLKAAFKERSVEKTYLAIVVGDFGAVTGEMRNLIGRHPVHRTKMAVVESDGKPAVTRYRVLASTQQVSLVEVRIETGRTHQIRVHFANINHPVLGDTVYGGRQRDLLAQPARQMLHAWKLVFPHPRTGVMREYIAPLPGDFCEALRETGLPLIGECRERD